MSGRQKGHGGLGPSRSAPRRRWGDGLRRPVRLARIHGPLTAGPFPVAEQSSESDENGTVRALGPVA